MILRIAQSGGIVLASIALLFVCTLPSATFARQRSQRVEYMYDCGAGYYTYTPCQTYYEYYYPQQYTYTYYYPTYSTYYYYDTYYYAEDQQQYYMYGTSPWW